MNDKINDIPSDKHLVSYNEQGFVLNYSVTRNEEIAFVDYKNDTITFKQMPLPIEKLREMLKYYESNKADHKKFLLGKTFQKETKDETSGSKSS